MTRAESYERLARMLEGLASSAIGPASRTHYFLQSQRWRALARLDRWLDRQVSPFAKNRWPAAKSQLLQLVDRADGVALGADWRAVEAERSEPMPHASAASNDEMRGQSGLMPAA